MIKMIQILKERILLARKALLNIDKDILSVILGEAQTLEARQGSITDEQVYNIIRKQIESNKEMVSFLPFNDTSSRLEKLHKENEILTELLPKTLNRETILNRISFDSSSLLTEIQNSNEGKAIGLLMKYCKSKGWNVLGEDIKKVVKQIKFPSVDL